MSVALIDLYMTLGGQPKLTIRWTVGGGTAGLVVAARLSEDPRVSVAVLEAGGTYVGLTMWSYMLANPLIHPIQRNRKVSILLGAYTSRANVDAKCEYHRLTQPLSSIRDSSRLGSSNCSPNGS